LLRGKADRPTEGSHNSPLARLGGKAGKPLDLLSQFSAALVLIVMIVFLFGVTAHSSTSRPIRSSGQNFSPLNIVGKAATFPYDEIPRSFIEKKTSATVYRNWISLPGITRWRHSKIHNGKNIFWSYFPGSASDTLHGLTLSKNLRVVPADRGHMRVEITARMTEDTKVDALVNSVAKTPTHYNCASSANATTTSQSSDVNTGVLTLKADAGESCLEISLPPSREYVATFEFRVISGSGAICFYASSGCISYFSLAQYQKWHEVNEFVDNTSHRSLDFFIYGIAGTSSSLVQYRDLELYLSSPVKVPPAFYEYLTHAG
jgi:hypothetical protein